MLNFNQSALDPYKILGVDRSASFSDIRKAYLAKVRELHPDQFQDPQKKSKAEQCLKDVNNAFDILGNKHGIRNSNDQHYDRSYANFSSMSLDDLDRLYYQSMEEILETDAGKVVVNQIDEITQKDLARSSLSQRFIIAGIAGITVSTGLTFFDNMVANALGSAGILLSGVPIVAGVIKSREGSSFHELFDLEEKIHQMSLNRMNEKLYSAYEQDNGEKPQRQDTPVPLLTPQRRARF